MAALKSPSPECPICGKPHREHRIPGACDAHTVARLTTDTGAGAVIVQDPRTSEYVVALTHDGHWTEAAECGRDLAEARERFIGYAAAAARHECVAQTVPHVTCAEVVTINARLQVYANARGW